MIFPVEWEPWDQDHYQPKPVFRLCSNLFNNTYLPTKFYQNQKDGYDESKEKITSNELCFFLAQLREFIYWE